MKCTKCEREIVSGEEWEFGADIWCQGCWEDYCHEEFWKAAEQGKIV